MKPGRLRTIQNSHTNAGMLVQDLSTMQTT